MPILRPFSVEEKEEDVDGEEDPFAAFDELVPLANLEEDEQ